MNMRTILSLSLSALVFGVTTIGCTATGGAGMASASDRSAGADAKAAAKNAGNARKALAAHDAAAAIRFAEVAVGLSPREPDYRMTLAESYLKAGRFDSARQAYADVLALAPATGAGSGKAALNLALAQIATGDADVARQTLATYAAAIPVGDLGLALALAGDTQRGVALLMQAARAAESNAKLRQNLALALALSGNWGGARIAAAADMSPADIDARMQQWAVFAQPDHASDQVATLLGVTRAQDSGQPVALALSAPVPVAANTSTTTVAPTPVAVEASAVTVVPPSPVVAVSLPAWAPAAAPVAPPLVAASAPMTVAAAVVFAPSREVVQVLPPPLIRAEPAPAKVAAVSRVSASAPPASGDWYVQLGAYSNAAVAKDGWNRVKRRFASLGNHPPRGMNFAVNGGSYYRLSVGGFARADADRLCRDLRARGGACFVRRDGGDRVAQWLARPTQVAAR